MQITRHRPTPPRPLAPKQLQLPEEQTWSDSDLLRRSLVKAAISGTLTGAAAVMVVVREIHARLSSKP